MLTFLTFPRLVNFFNKLQLVIFFNLKIMENKTKIKYKKAFVKQQAKLNIYQLHREVKTNFNTNK